MAYRIAAIAMSFGRRRKWPAIQQRQQHDQRVHDRGHAGLGRCDHAAQDRADDNNRNHQRQDGAAKRPAELDHGGARFAQAGKAEEVAVDHQADADHQAGHGAAEEQAADRGVSHRAVDDGHDGGRHHRGDGGAGGDQCGGEGGAVALRAWRASARFRSQQCRRWRSRRCRRRSCRTRPPHARGRCANARPWPG